MPRNATVRAERRAESVRRFQPRATTQLQQIVDALRSKIRLAVIFGGNKTAPGSVLYQSQNARSWKSYEAVATDIALALKRNGFHNVELIAEDMNLGERLRHSNIHMAWLNSGGVQGYNSAAHAATMLEMLGVPYVGHDPLSATTLDNKHSFKRGAVCAGLPTAPFMTWHMGRGRFKPDLNSRFSEIFGNYTGPFVVKPVSGRASLHVHVVPDVQSLPAIIAEIYGVTGDLVLIEKYLTGREFCISVAGRITSRQDEIFRNCEPFAFGALERILAPGELIFTSMDTSPITESRLREVSHHEERLWDELHRLARDVYLEFNLGSLIRLDVRADETGKLHILEANPKPDLKYPSAGVTSLVSAGLAQTNLTYDDLISSIFADRLDFLLRHRRASMKHILEVIPMGTVDFSEFDVDSTLREQDTDLMVDRLAEKSRQMHDGIPSGSRPYYLTDL